MLLVSHKTKSVVIGFRPDIHALMPHGKRFTWEGKDMIVVPHGIDETKLLRNLDFTVPAPIVEHYGFPSVDGNRPFDKQVLTAASMTMYPHSFVLNGMGTGKTKACIWAFDYLKSVVDYETAQQAPLGATALISPVSNSANPNATGTVIRQQ